MYNTTAEAAGTKHLAFAVACTTLIATSAIADDTFICNAVIFHLS